MKRALLVLSTLGALAGVAAAQSKVLVLHAEGKADLKTRQKVDGALVKLAKQGPDAITGGEITFGEAAEMVGCKPEEPACRDQVIDALGVDELVIVNVNPKPPGYEITVRRAKKGGAVHDAATTVAADKTDQVAPLGPLFNVKGTTTTPPPVEIGPKPADPKPMDSKPLDINPNPNPNPPIEVKPVDPKPPVDPSLDPIGKPVEPTKPPVVTDKPPKDRRRLTIAGMAAGGGMAFLGMILWTAASGVQGQIDDAPTRTADDLARLRDLESKGDNLAAAGNVFFISGLVLGGVSTYFFVKNRREQEKKPPATTAWFAPALFDHGAGVSLTIGGRP